MRLSTEKVAWATARQEDLNLAGGIDRDRKE